MLSGFQPKYIVSRNSKPIEKKSQKSNNFLVEIACLATYLSDKTITTYNETNRRLGEYLFQVVSPQSPCFDKCIMHLYRSRESLVSIIRPAKLCQEHSLESIKLGCHLLGEVLEVGRLNNLQSFLMWALGVIVAGGLLGLGAPFWFKIFNRLSAMAIPAARATLTAPPKAPGAPPVLIKVSDVRPAASSDPEDLERGFLTVIGRNKVMVAAEEANADGIGRLENARPGIKRGERPPELT